MNQTDITTLYLYAFLFTLSARLYDITFSANRSCKSSRLWLKAEDWLEDQEENLRSTKKMSMTERNGEEMS